MRGKRVAAVLAAALLLAAGCGAAGEAEREPDGRKTEIQLFAAASLRGVLEELADKYQEERPEVKITLNADSSGTLLAQIREGYACDLFFSAAEKQMDELEKEGLTVPGTRTDVLQNHLAVVTQKGSGTKVTGLQSLGEAQSIALAGGSVPAGKYTRQALVNLGILEQTEEVDKITTQEIAYALGGAEISEQSNVSKVLTAVAEGSCEVGTVYLSDVRGYADRLEILEIVGKELTGDVVYPLCRVVNEEADAAQKKEAEAFYRFLLSEQAGKLYEAYGFETR